MTTLTTVTWALGLRSTPQSLGVIGRDMGVFERHGLELHIVREETAGPEGARGLLNEEYQFAEFGTVPIVQAALDGADPLILMAAEQQSALFILSRAGVPEPALLRGGRLGVLSVAGQTGYSAMRMLDQWGLSGNVELVPCQTYPRIYESLAAGELDAGVLTADYKIAGAIAYGIQTLADLGAALRYQGPVVATTRRLRDAQPRLVQQVVNAYLDTLRLFKHSDSVAPCLQRHLRFVNAAQASAIRSYYAQRFQSRPYPSAEGLTRVIESMRGERDAPWLTPEALCDTSFLTRALDTMTEKQ